MGKIRKKIHGRANHANTQGGGGVEQRFGYAALLKKFSLVSVREYSGVEICRREFGVDAKVVLAPTMLLPRTDYDEIADSYSSSASEKPYCFEYVFG